MESQKPMVYDGNNTTILLKIVFLASLDRINFHYQSLTDV